MSTAHCPDQQTAAQVLPRHAGPCLHPVVLVKHHAGSPIATETILKRCNSRYVEDCRSCAFLWHGDANRMAHDGLHKPGMLYVKVTLTLSSFGPLHFAGRYSRTQCKCGQVHCDDDERLGTPLRPDDYKYSEAVRANATLPMLWSRSMGQLKEVIKKMRGSAEDCTVAWFGVPEPHRSGTMHVHAILALPLEIEDLKLYEKESRRRSDLLEKTFAGFNFKTKLAGEKFTMRWGSDIMVELVQDIDNDISTSYLLKHVGERSPFRPKHRGTAYSSHALRLHEAAGSLIRLQLVHGELTPSEAASRLKRTEAGWTGNPIWKSRNWTPLSFETLRSSRRAHARGPVQQSTKEPDGEWRFAGQIHRQPEPTPESKSTTPPVPTVTAVTTVTTVTATAETTPNTDPSSMGQAAHALRVQKTAGAWICIDGFHSSSGSSRAAIAAPAVVAVDIHAYSMGLGVG